MATEAADIVNRALAEISAGPYVTDMYDGSPQARVALRVYGQTRDELLRSKVWPFARRSLMLTVLKRATVPPPLVLSVNNWSSAQPPPPWLWEYAWPSDCLELRYIRLPPFAVTGGDANVEPAPILFTIANDTPAGGGSAVKVILCNIPFALAHYTARVTEPDAWEAIFTEALVDALAKKFSIALAKVQQPIELMKEKLVETIGTVEMGDDIRT